MMGEGKWGDQEWGDQEWGCIYSCCVSFFFFSFCSFSKNVTIKIQKIKSLFGDFSSWLPRPHLHKKAL